MNSFLYRVAQTFHSHYQEDISSLKLVFPNHRAGLFFQHYLGEVVGKPLFSPEILTINECFAMASDWQSADRLSMLFRLYRIFIEHSQSEETFDSFVYWGEMLLADFNDVDKYRADARQLFTNITELREIDRIFNVFSPEQIEAIRQFWSNFEPVQEGKTKEEFIATWKILYPVYEQLRAELIAESTATEGMICRDVADRLEAKEDIPEFAGKQFVFVGFNALNPCEKKLMEELQRRGQADFYWDYEAAELRDSDNPASLFYAENIHAFHTKYPIEPVVELLTDKKIELIAVPSAVGQAKQVYDILNKLYPDEQQAASRKQEAGSSKQQTPELSNSQTTDYKLSTINYKLPTNNWVDTAVVLPDESLLVPLLHSFPQQIEKINITMGFPLKATPVSGLIEHIFELQRRMRVSGNDVSFYHQTVSNILNHQYIALLCATESAQITHEMTVNNRIYIAAEELHKNELLTAIFVPQTETQKFLPYLLNILRALQKGWQMASDDKKLYQLERDFLYQYYITINRMVDIINARPAEVEMELDTLMRLTRQLIAGITIPFIGEPLDGLQVMGVLETRGIDFENLIVTSFNEGIFPSKSASNSFIPYNLRKGFNLPTHEHQDAITAYNFYRLIHRAKRIYFLYDSRTEGMQTGEISRFAHQLYYHYGVEARHKNVSFDIGFGNQKAIEIQKSADVMEKLQAFCTESDESKSLSASSINSYIDCPLQFYLTRVEAVEEADEVHETVESNMFGSIFHKTMENLYAAFKRHIIHPDDVDLLIKNPARIDKEIHIAFNTEHFKRKSGQMLPLEGNNILIASVLRKYVLQVLKVDKAYAPFTYHDSEARHKMQYPIRDGKLKVNLKGFIDRIDEKEGRLRILDYKTGIGKLDFSNLSDAFDREKKDRPKFVLQTLLYCLLYEHETGKRNTVPGIFYIRDAFKEDFDTALNDKELKQKVTEFSYYEMQFGEKLTACLEEIFNPEIPFGQTSNEKVCEYCPYRGICNK